jgi:UDP-2,4-diacetamido-2,4,6-trideoxy-beta-L-altropyranose hydrolase
MISVSTYINNKKMNIVFRVDAHVDIALGHLSRCLSLGQSLNELGCQVSFVVFDNNEAEKRLRQAKFSFDLSPYKINESGDCEHFISICKDNSFDLMLVDSYSLDNRFFEQARKAAPVLAYIDDLGHDYKADIVINSSCRAVDSDYQAKLKILGSDYVILDKSYWVEPVRDNQKAETLLITFGGIDHYDLSSRLLPIVEKIDENIKVNMVIGPYYENRDKIVASVSRSKLDVEIIEGLASLYSVIQRSDVAVTAGGITAYELAASAIPCVGIALWDCQNDNVNFLSSKNTLIPLYYSDSAEFDAHLSSSLELLLTNNALRETMSKEGRRLIDGKGALKICETILERYG